MQAINRAKRILLGLTISSMVAMAGCQSPSPTQPGDEHKVSSEARAKADAKRREFESRYKVASLACHSVPVLYCQDIDYFEDWPVDGDQHRCEMGYDSGGNPVYVIEVYNCGGLTYDLYEFYSGNEAGLQWYHLTSCSTSSPIGGCGSASPTPVPSPTPSNTVKPLTLGLDYNAFSPNQPQGDGVKDSLPIHIGTDASLGPWTLEVQDHPGTLDGTPDDKTKNQDFSWNGQVNGIILPDGKYTLRLTAGDEVKTADVIIDTQAPEISKIAVSEGTEPNSYIITASISDKGLSGLSVSRSLVNPHE